VKNVWKIHPDIRIESLMVNPDPDRPTPGGSS
jgi:hypothetical protein